MIKLVLLYNLKGILSDEYDKWYAEHHLPKSVKAIPGIRKVSYNTAVGAPEGEAKYTRLVECWFDDMDALKKALTSTEMQHAVEEAMPKITDLVMAFYEEKLQF